MTLRCGSCGALNADSMTTCGNCSAPLTEANRVPVQTEKTENPDYGAAVRCPYCGRPMEEGVFDVPASRGLRPRWLSGSGEEEIGSYSITSYEYAGYRCTSCNSMLVYY